MIGPSRTKGRGLGSVSWAFQMKGGYWIYIHSPMLRRQLIKKICFYVSSQHASFLAGKVTGVSAPPILCRVPGPGSRGPDRSAEGLGRGGHVPTIGAGVHQEASPRPHRRFGRPNTEERYGQQGDRDCIYRVPLSYAPISA